jgi:glycosyltransferase involved in cell wall biosynthesis
MNWPRFSIVTPVYNTNRRHLEQCIASVLAQTFDDWELCLVDDKSPKNYVREVLREAEQLDSRIRTMFRSENGGIVAASNDGLAMARGEFVVLLDHDDILEPDALQLTHDLLISDSEIDYVYTDETLMTDKGEVIERFHKPDWSPERFRHQMYVCHLSTIRRSIVSDVGGFRSGFDGAQDYDLIFRVTERARKIGHVPHLLYHWRMAESSVANNASAKPYAYDAGKRAIEAHFERNGVDATVGRLEKFPGNYRVERTVSAAMTVDVLVPITGISGSVWGVERQYHQTTLGDLSRSPGLEIKLVPFEGSASPVVDLNQAVRRSEADIVILASECLEPTTENWARKLIQPFLDDSVGIVSGVTYTANSRLEHAGYFLHGSFLDSAYFRIGRDNRGQRAVLETNFEISAVDWQCMAIRSSLFSELNGFDESLDHPWTVVDLCLRSWEAGHVTLVAPQAEFFNFSNNDDFARFRKRAPRKFREKWAEVFANDPYRPKPPRRMSRESERPFWRPERLRDYRKR